MPKITPLVGGRARILKPRNDTAKHKSAAISLCSLLQFKCMTSEREITKLYPRLYVF